MEIDEHKWRENDPKRFRTDVYFAPDPSLEKQLKARLEELKRQGKWIGMRDKRK